MISREYAKVFLDNQEKLFDEPVAGNVDEAVEFLEEVMAQVVDNVDELREYFDEAGMDTDDMTDEELMDSLEVFKLNDGKLLIVEG